MISMDIYIYITLLLKTVKRKELKLPSDSYSSNIYNQCAVISISYK